MPIIIMFKFIALYLVCLTNFVLLGQCAESAEDIIDSLNESRLSAISMAEDNVLKNTMLQSHEKYQNNLKSIIDKLVAEENSKIAESCPDCENVEVTQATLNYCLKDEEISMKKHKFVLYIRCLYNETLSMRNYVDQIYRSLRDCQVQGAKLSCDTSNLLILETMKTRVDDILHELKTSSKELEVKLTICQDTYPYEELSEDLLRKKSFTDCLFKRNNE